MNHLISLAKISAVFAALISTCAFAQNVTAPVTGTVTFPMPAPVPGPQGPAGKTGATGSQGTPGVGVAGPQGIPGVSPSSASVEALLAADPAFVAAVAASLGAITPPPPPPIPTVTLTASPLSITAGASSTLTWSSTNAVACAPLGPTVTGSLVVSPSATTTYAQTCTNAAGSASKSVMVTVTPVVVTPPPPTTSTCILCTSAVVFNDTFDAPAGTGTRAGDLNGNVWGVSRTLGAGVNFGQGQYGMWNQVARLNCDGSTTQVVPPADIFICNGQLREAVNDNNNGGFDNGDVTSLAMYPKQPFDFAGRTGTVSFDVSDDAYNIHDAWPEFWMSDAPIPDPFTHFGSWLALPANGFGVRFANAVLAGQQGECPNANNLTHQRWTVDSVVVSRNYVEEDVSANNGPTFGTLTGMKVTPLDCVISSSGPGNMNHVEVRVSQSTIDVYATDAGVAATPTTLRHIATITGANLTLTRGLIWLIDAHYNADKATTLTNPNLPSSASHRQHTFSWDNVAFDGPFTDRDFTFDCPDALTPSSNGAVNLGRFSAANQQSSCSANIPAFPSNGTGAPAAAKVLFDFSPGGDPEPTVLNLTVNGHAISAPWAAPQNAQTVVPTPAWATYAVQIPLTDLVAGANTVQLGADVAMVFANVDVVLADVAGGVAVLPGSNNAYP